jgi:hypothetical protein
VPRSSGSVGRQGKSLLPPADPGSANSEPPPRRAPQPSRSPPDGRCRATFRPQAASPPVRAPRPRRLSACRSTPPLSPRPGRPRPVSDTPRPGHAHNRDPSVLCAPRPGHAPPAPDTPRSLNALPRTRPLVTPRSLAPPHPLKAQAGGRLGENPLKGTGGPPGVAHELGRLAVQSQSGQIVCDTLSSLGCF